MDENKKTDDIFTLTVKDMAMLISIRDGVEELDELMGKLYDAPGVMVNQGIIGKLRNVTDLICLHSPMYKAHAQNTEFDFEESEFGRILNDTSLSYEERAKIIMKG